MSWDRRLDLHIDVDAASSRALIVSATDSTPLSSPPELVAGDKLIVRVYFWRRGSTPGSLEAIDPGETATFVFSGRPLGVPADSPVLFLEDDFTEVETGVWEATVDLNTAEIVDHLEDAPAGAKTITAEIEVRDASDTSRRSLQFPARIMPQVWSNDNPPAQAAPADAVRYSPQTLSDSQKQVAQENIGLDGLWRNRYPINIDETPNFFDIYPSSEVYEFESIHNDGVRRIKSTFFNMGSATAHKGSITADDGALPLDDMSASLTYDAGVWTLDVAGQSYSAPGSPSSSLNTLEWTNIDDLPLVARLLPTTLGTMAVLGGFLFIYQGVWYQQRINLGSSLVCSGSVTLDTGSSLALNFGSITIHATSLSAMLTAMGLTVSDLAAKAFDPTAAPVVSWPLYFSLVRTSTSGTGAITNSGLGVLAVASGTTATSKAIIRITGDSNTDSLLVYRGDSALKLNFDRRHRWRAMIVVRAAAGTGTGWIVFGAPYNLTAGTAPAQKGFGIKITTSGVALWVHDGTTLTVGAATAVTASVYADLVLNYQSGTLTGWLDGTALTSVSSGPSGYSATDNGVAALVAYSPATSDNMIFEVLSPKSLTTAS